MRLTIGFMGGMQLTIRIIQDSVDPQIRRSDILSINCLSVVHSSFYICMGVYVCMHGWMVMLTGEVGWIH